jgi:hypothetical protein
LIFRQLYEILIAHGEIDMSTNAIRITEQTTPDGREATITFSDVVRPLAVIKRGDSPAFLRLPRGTRAAPVSRLDLDPPTARSFAGALMQGAIMAEDWDQ